ncbi:hypothetical protein B0T16DRAFT_107359 [Cercophora newfieldiana]|uniref:Uncharacterized protein n=1 Tax=Cercophora newfieldiana TaxID=92897 RepID=A0AA39YKX6_9PEZI|nr:hypothetical protein B0T16DRAFT_107359 [Cercophora newfieldiana]
MHHHQHSEHNTTLPGSQHDTARKLKKNSKAAPQYDQVVMYGLYTNPGHRRPGRGPNRRPATVTSQLPPKAEKTPLPFQCHQEAPPLPKNPAMHATQTTQDALLIPTQIIKHAEERRSRCPAQCNDKCQSHSCPGVSTPGVNLGYFH